MVGGGGLNKKDLGGIIVIKTMEQLENCFKVAKEKGLPYVGVQISMPDLLKPEVIINPAVNFDAKLEYYKKAYNEDLTLKSFPSIKIVGFGFSGSYQGIVYKETSF